MPGFLRRCLALMPVVGIVWGQYYLQDFHQGSSFFNGFSFFTDTDPTDGFVNYVDQATAQQNGLITIVNNVVYIGVDYTSVLNPDGSQGGRQSTRIQSNNVYSGGLIIGDFSHMPEGCGTWPAFWTIGPNWPYNGEIDIIEGINSQSANLESLHTGDGCTISGNGQSGTLLENDCYQYSSSGSGCGTISNTPSSYGSGFNSVGGGVYAAEWTGSLINIYFFPRSSIPADITNQTPNPSGWGTPSASFSGCDFSSHIDQNQIILDQTFCGQWGGSEWSTDSVCSPLASSCNDFVAQNPGSFKNAFWGINYIAVYQPSGGAAAAEDIARPQEAAASSDASSSVPVASTSPIPSIAHDAAGATGQPLLPGVTPPAKVPPASLTQVPAVLNTTSS